MTQLRFVRRQGAVEEVRYRKGDDGQRYKHATEAPTDLWLVDVDGQKGSLVLPRGAGDGWEKDRTGYWLTNKPKHRRARAMATRTTRRGTTRRKAKRPPPRGFKSWSTYMASIRPGAKRTSARKASRKRKVHASSHNTPGGTVARKRKRGGGRKAKRARSSSRRVVVHQNKPRSHRRRYRRNGSFMGRGIVGQVMTLAKEGVIGGITNVAGEATTRLVRGRVFGMAAGETISSATEFGLAIAGGLLVQKMFGRQVAHDYVVGGTAGIIRSTAKQLGIPFVSEALSDDGPRLVRRLNGYVPRRPGIAGYVGAGGSSALSGETEKELGYQA
jgi:hypothetical protein